MLSFVAIVGFWVDHSVGREEAFRVNAAAVLAMDSSQEAIASRLMDEAIEAVPLLALVRGAGERAIVTLLDSGAFDEAFDRLIVEAHRHVTSQNEGPFVADLTDVRDTLVAPIERISPDLAERIPVDAFEEVVILDSDALPLVEMAARWLPGTTIFAAAAAVFLSVALIMLARRRSVVMLAVGSAVGFAGVGASMWASVGGSVASGRTDDELTRVLVANGYEIVSPWLRSAGVTVAILGAVLAAAGAVGLAVGWAGRGNGS